MGVSKVKALCVATRCATVEQFVSTFHRFSDERSFFVATLNARPIGLETPFSIQLADRTPVLRGTCRVQAAWTTGDNPFKRPGIQLAIQRLTPDSERVFQLLHAARRSAPPEPITELTDSPSEAPAAVSIPPIPGAAAKPTMPLPSVARTSTARRAMTEPVPVVAAAPKSPPEVKLLEVILPPRGEAAVVEAIKPESTVETRVIEERTPGSELVLPANPLQNLTDESIEGFVDCTLYEETATFFRSGDGTEFGEPAGPPPPALPPALLVDEAIRASSGLFALQPSGEMIPIVVENPTTGQMSPIVVENQQQRARRITGQLMPVPELRPNRLTGPQMPVRAHRTTGQPFVMQTTGSVAGLLPTGQMAQIVVQTSSSQMGPLPTDPMAPIVMQTQHASYLHEDAVHTPVPAGEAFPPPERHRRTTRLAAVTAPRRWMVIGGAALGATVIFVLVLATRSSASDTESTPPPPPPKVASQPPTRAVEPAKVTPPRSEPRPAVVENTDTIEPTDPAGSPLVGEGPCKLDVQTTPAGTMVSFDGRSVGPSPITVAGSCDIHKVDFAHPRYKTEQRVVKMIADQVTKVDVSLIRPTHQLRVLTSPPGAEIFIGGRRAGMSPTILQINGFSGIDVRVERMGFKPVSKRVYSKVPDDTLAIGMSPLPRPK